MSASQDPNLGLNYGWDLGESKWNTGMDANMTKLGAVVQLSVISRTSNQPASPANGDRYIHNGDASWSVGATDDVVVYLDGAWTAYTPSEGWVTRVEDEDTRIEYAGGSWGKIGGLLYESDLAAQGGTVPETDRSNDFGANLQKLDAAGGQWETYTSDDTPRTVIAFRDSGNNVVAKLDLRGLDGAGAGYLQFREGDQYRFRDGGIVVGSGASDNGAGTVTAEQSLVLGSTASDDLLLEGYVHLGRDKAGVGNSLGGVTFQWNGTRIAQIVARTGDDTTNKDEGDLQFYTASGGVLSEVMRLHQEGGVAIGSATQQGAGTLSVENDAYVKGLNLSDTAVIVKFTDTDTSDPNDYGRMIYSNGTWEFDWWDDSTASRNDNILKIVGSSQQVGIGTGSPTGTLDVHGSVTVGSNASDNGDGTITTEKGIHAGEPVHMPSYTVSGLPAAGTAARVAYASDGRKNGEGAGSGTGVLVFDDGSNWIAVDTGQTVAS